LSFSRREMDLILDKKFLKNLFRKNHICYRSSDKWNIDVIPTLGGTLALF
jgi:hypothetical protein